MPRCFGRASKAHSIHPLKWLEYLSDKQTTQLIRWVHLPIGMNYMDTEPAARAHMEEFDITYPKGPDLGRKIVQAYRIQVVPETFIVDNEGNSLISISAPSMGLRLWMCSRAFWKWNPALGI